MTFHVHVQSEKIHQVCESRWGEVEEPIEKLETPPEKANALHSESGIRKGSLEI